MLGTPPESPQEPDPGPPRLTIGELTDRRADRRGRDRRRRRRRIVLLGVTVPILGVLIYFGVSYGRYMTEPTSMTWAERSAEWVRNDVPFGNWIVDTGESVTNSAPRKGGPQLRSLPSVGLGSTPESRPRRSVHRSQGYRPPRIRSLFSTPLAGEGVWHPAGPRVDGAPPILVTTYRPSTTYPQDLAYVMWVDHTRTDIAYYPGRYEPPSAVDRGPMMVPHSQYDRLLATFNGAFTHVDTNNGSAVNGHTNEPLIDGNATLVGYRNGRVDILRWSGGPDAPANIAWARQSLTPILWNGQLNPELDTDPNSVQWGYTLGGVLLTPRTAVGIDRHGNLMFVVGMDESVITIAEILRHIGAVRGMEFDINPEWHTLITYSHAAGLDPKLVEPQSQQSPDRYLTPDDRDFFAVYKRRPGPVTVPFR